MTARPAIPKSLGDLTGDWFTAAFAAEDAIDAGTIDSVVVTELTETSGQDGFYALVDVEYAKPSPGAPSRVFVKILDLPPDRGGFFTEQMVREVYFFREFAPRTSARVPAFYYGDYSSDFRSGVLVTEALDGWEFGSFERGVDLPRAHAVARALGLLNGSSMDDPGLINESAVIRYDAESQFVRQLHEGYSKSLNRHNDEFAELIGPDLMSLAEQIESSVPQLLINLRSDDASVNHGDCRVDNMAFRLSSNGWEVALFDFGMCTIGDGMPDLSQCLASAMPTVSETDLRSVVETYRLALRESGPYSASTEETWKHYRRSMLSPFIARIFTLNRFEAIAPLEHSTALERMRFNSWKNVMTHSQMLQIWEMV